MMTTTKTLMMLTMMTTDILKADPPTWRLVLLPFRTATMSMRALCLA
jgi:hypothetical protein